MPSKLSVKIGKLTLLNPVTVASGTFGYTEEFRDFIDIKKLGAIVTKTITFRPREGNPSPRTCETPAGMLNSIGLQNPGAEVFFRNKLPLLKKWGVPVIVSVASETGTGELFELVRLADKAREISAIELNISCPNIYESQAAPCLPAGRNHERRINLFVSQSAKMTGDFVGAARKATSKTLITKLSPNVTDIAGIALAAEAAGSDAVSLVNTFLGMSIDVGKRRTKTFLPQAGLSGPAIRPIAVRMVHEVYQRIKIPIIGMGGIMDTQSALEFIIAGASAISVGTANFINPGAAAEIREGIKSYLFKNRIRDIKDLTGSLQV